MARIIETPATILRFDVELTPEQLKAMDALLKECYRTRKNFAEALIALVLESYETSTLIDISRLGVKHRSRDIALLLNKFDKGEMKSEKKAKPATGNLKPCTKL